MGDLFDMEASTPQKRSKRVALVLSLSSLIIASMLHHFPQLTELSVAAVGGGGVMKQGIAKPTNLEV